MAVAGLLGLSACSADISGGPLVRSGQPVGTLVVTNGSSVSLTAVLISDCDNFTYGFNRLPDGVSIRPGESYPFQVSAGCWDVDAGAYGSGEAAHRLQVAAGGITEYTVTD